MSFGADVGSRGYVTRTNRSCVRPARLRTLPRGLLRGGEVTSVFGESGVIGPPGGGGGAAPRPRERDPGESDVVAAPGERGLSDSEVAPVGGEGVPGESEVAPVGGEGVPDESEVAPVGGEGVPGESEVAPVSGEGGPDELDAASARRRRERERSGNMLPRRERRRFLIERLLMRLVATCGIVGIGTALGAILVSSNVRGWITGFVVALVSVMLSAILWSSRQV